MFAQLLTHGDFFSSHWVVVIGIGLAFFIVQTALTARFYLRMRQHERILKQLCRDFQKGGDGRGDLRALPESFAWIQWVIAKFPAMTSTPPGNYTREEVLQELDTRIASNSDYLLLQRMGVMAPLLGVVLTVVGFYWLQVGEEVQSLQSILLAVTPLVSGVGTGAVLALINQVLLHVAGRRVESLRMSARTWFDAVIWSNIGLDTQAATVKAVRAMERLASSMGKAAGQYNGASDQISRSTASMQDAATQFREVVQSFSAEIKGIPDALFDVRRSTAASAAALDELIQVGSRAVANLDVSVAAFRTTVDRQFADAATLHHRSSKILAESVQQIIDAAELLKSGSDEFKRTARANTASFEMMDESIRRHVLPGNRQFHDAVQAVTGQVESFSEAVRELLSNVDAISGEFDNAAGKLLPSVCSLCETIEDRFRPAVTQHSAQLESVGNSIDQMQTMGKSMTEATAVVTAMLHEMSKFLGQTRMSQDSLAGTTRCLADAGELLRRSVENDVAPSQRSMHEIITSLARSAAHLADFSQRGLEPATRQLVTLHETLAGLKDAVDSIQKFSQTRPDIDRLSNTLARAAEISDTISLLPEQIREIVELKVDHVAAPANSRGGLRTWFSRRPR